MNIVTTRKAVQIILKKDENNAINEDMLRRLFKSEKLPSWKHGNRTVCEISLLIEGLNTLLGLEEKKRVPRIRSIHNAFLELRTSSPELGISEERIRVLVGMNKLPHIRVGNRVYIALESFEDPYNECLIYDDYRESEEAMLDRVAQEQFELAMERRNKRK